MEITVNATYEGMIMNTPEQTVSGTIVTQENYCRAETDWAFANGLKLSGGVNRWLHFRNLTPLDQQTVVRMNRDTLYSTALVDTSKGATLTVPQMPEGRYFSVLMVDNDHYTPGVIYESGTHELPQDTKYLSSSVSICTIRMIRLRLLW
jgi:hypothetical protein